MPKITSDLFCPKCGRIIFVVGGTCNNIIMHCPQCNALMFIDASYDGSTVVRVKPKAEEKTEADGKSL